MDQDITDLLRSWSFESGRLTARRITGEDGRTRLQFRIECGVLQMETQGRPDGARPHGWESYLEHLVESDRRSRADFGEPLTLGDDDWGEIDRELKQYYHRRLCWLAIREFPRAIDDADHNLALMDFLREHTDDTRRSRGYEQYRPFILLHRTQAAAQMQLDLGDAEAALEDIREGSQRIRDFLQTRDPEDEADEDVHLQMLADIDKQVRRRFGIEKTLREELDEAVADQDYEKAARLRDRMQRRRRNV